MYSVCHSIDLDPGSNETVVVLPLPRVDRLPSLLRKSRAPWTLQSPRGALRFYPTSPVFGVLSPYMCVFSSLFTSNNLTCPRALVLHGCRSLFQSQRSPAFPDAGGPGGEWSAASSVSAIIVSAGNSLDASRKFQRVVAGSLPYQPIPRRRDCGGKTGLFGSLVGGPSGVSEDEGPARASCRGGDCGRAGWRPLRGRKGGRVVTRTRVPNRQPRARRLHWWRGLGAPTTFKQTRNSDTSLTLGVCDEYPDILLRGRHLLSDRQGVLQLVSQEYPGSLR